MSDSPPQQSVASGEPTNVSRGHGDYVQISIDNRTGTELGISHATLSSGKFHVVGNKSSILTPASVNTITIPNGTTGDVCSCGHNSASVGTEGSFWITAHNDLTLVTKVVWDCPYSGSKRSRIPDFGAGSRHLLAVSVTSLAPTGGFLEKAHTTGLVPRAHCVSSLGEAGKSLV